jgi:hypothetical protein
LIAEVLRDLFFAAVRSRQPRFDRHVRHGELLAQCLHYVIDSGLFASYFWTGIGLLRRKSHSTRRLDRLRPLQPNHARAHTFICPRADQR